MKNDLISRSAAIEALDKIFPADPMRNVYTQGITCGAALATEYIKQLPSAQPEIEPKTGHWIRGDFHQLSNVPSNDWICSECGCLVETAHYAYRCYYNYCPYCGAKMEVEKE